MFPSWSFALLSAAALACDAANGAGLYRCSKNGVLTYAVARCTSGEAAPITIDRAVPRDALAGENGSRPAALPSPHRLSQAERERIARLRRDEPDLNEEGRIASEVEIAAIREGADAVVSAADRAVLESLRAQLASPDAQVRASALAHWRTLYARYRIPAHPRLKPAPSGLGRAPPASREPPLGDVVPGTQGPLASPGQPPALALPSRPPPVADPQTGRVLAPAGSDRMIDPVTGTLWMRSGSVYVDPLSGRIIPSP